MTILQLCLQVFYLQCQQEKVFKLRKKSFNDVVTCNLNTCTVKVTQLLLIIVYFIIVLGGIPVYTQYRYLFLL